MAHDHAFILRILIILVLCTSVISQFYGPYGRFPPISEPYSYKGQRSSASCDEFFDTRSDYNGAFAIIVIPEPDIPQSETRLVLTVATQLQSVSLKVLNDVTWGITNKIKRRKETAPKKED